MKTLLVVFSTLFALPVFSQVMLPQRHGLTYVPAGCGTLENAAAARFTVTLPHVGTGAGPLNALSDSKVFTLSFWVRMDSNDTNLHRIVWLEDVTDATFWINRETTTRLLRIQGRNAAKVNILNVATSATLTDADGWTHIYLTVDMADSSKRRLYRNGVLDSATWTTYTDDVLDLAPSASVQFLLGFDHLDANPFIGSLSEFWWDDVYLDAPEKFIVNGCPANLGTTGECPNNAPPAVYYSRNGSGTSWLHDSSGNGNHLSASGPGLLTAIGPCGESLNDGLLAYWKLDEVSGTRNDSFSTNNLVDNNTVGSTAGVLGNAANFVKTSTEFLSIASNTNMSLGAYDFTRVCWVRFTTPPADSSDDHIIIGKDQSGAREFLLYRRGNGNVFGVANFAGGTPNILNASTFGTLSTNVWYFLVTQYNRRTGIKYIGVNNGTMDFTSISGTDYATSPLYLGARSYVGSEAYLNGDIDEVGFWNRLLTAGELTRLYNGGAGLTYPFN